ncbi:MAG: pseudaminic acid synthase [Rickettsiales bacterium]
MKIANREIGTDQPPFIIAELSGNHDGSLEKAIALVEAAAKAGADAIKLQTYTADTMTINCKSDDFLISDKESLWSGYYLYDLYERAHTPWQWHETLFNRAKELGMIAFSTPFDATAVDFLEKLNVPCYKIASFENTDIPLIKKVAATGKPMIISCGMAQKEEIKEAVETARNAGAKDICLLKCTSSYPARIEDANLRTINDLRESFSTHVGISDHTLGITVPVAAVAMGACVIEKHIVLKRGGGEVDGDFSIEPEELQQMREAVDIAWKSRGKISYGPASAKEESSKIFRRSIYASKDIKKGEVFTTDNIRVIRPNNGLEPKYFEDIIGKKAAADLQFGTALKHEHIDYKI